MRAASKPVFSLDPRQLRHVLPGGVRPHCSLYWPACKPPVQGLRAGCSKVPNSFVGRYSPTTTRVGITILRPRLGLMPVTKDNGKSCCMSYPLSPSHLGASNRAQMGWLGAVSKADRSTDASVVRVSFVLGPSSYVRTHCREGRQQLLK